MGVAVADMAVVVLIGGSRNGVLVRMSLVSCCVIIMIQLAKECLSCVVRIVLVQKFGLGGDLEDDPPLSKSNLDSAHQHHRHDFQCHASNEQCMDGSI